MHGCNYSVKVLASIQLYAREVFPYIEYFVTTVLGDGGGEVKRIPYSYFYTILRNTRARGQGHTRVHVHGCQPSPHPFDAAVCMRYDRL